MHNPANFSAFVSQSKLPLSTTTPPTEVACPSIYFVVEWVTMSHPHSKGLQLMGVAKVLSTIKGTPLRWAMRANFSISSTAQLGFDIVSPKSSLVLGRKAACISSSEASG